MRGGCLLAVGARRARGSNKFSSVQARPSLVTADCAGPTAVGEAATASHPHTRTAAT